MPSRSEIPSMFVLVHFRMWKRRAGEGRRSRTFNFHLYREDTAFQLSPAKNMQAAVAVSRDGAILALCRALRAADVSGAVHQMRYPTCGMGRLPLGPRWLPPYHRCGTRSFRPTACRQSQPGGAHTHPPDPCALPKSHQLSRDMGVELGLSRGGCSMACATANWRPDSRGAQRCHRRKPL